MEFTTFSYQRIHWKNKSESLDTPLGRTLLNRMDSGIYNIAENLNIVHEDFSNGKLDKADAGKVIVGMPTWDKRTGILSFQFYDGTTFCVDFNVGKIPVSFSMDSAGVITMTTSDGTEWTADIGDVMPDYTFKDSDRIAFSRKKNADGSYTVSADIKKGSITGEYLQPNYLADITAQANNAAASTKQASDFVDSADFDAKLAQSYAVGGSGVRQGEGTDNAKYYKEQAASSATTATNKASEASTSAANAAASASTASQKATAAANSATVAKTSETNTKTSEESAASSATTATSQANMAWQSETVARTKATEAENYAKQAQSYAIGTGSVRPNESTDSAKYYYEQAKTISESFSGALRPMGTVTFANLPSLANATEGDMYNVSNQFTTNINFKEGKGNVIPAGANVYKTSDGKWDVLAGTPVTSVNGQRGNVNITPEDIGALPQNGKAADSAKLDGHSADYFAPADHTHNYDDLDGKWEAHMVDIDLNYYTKFGLETFCLQGASIEIGQYRDVTVMGPLNTFCWLASWSYSGMSLSLNIITPEDIESIRLQYFTKS